jgi:hypothetical protein
MKDAHNLTQRCSPEFGVHDARNNRNGTVVNRERATIV